MPLSKFFQIVSQNLFINSQTLSNGSKKNKQLIKQYNNPENLMNRIDGYRQKFFPSPNEKEELLYPSSVKNIGQESNAGMFQPMEIRCTKLIEMNQDISYNMSILQTQFETLKKIQVEKAGENKKIKQKVRQKLQRQQQLKKHMRLEDDKIKKITLGLKNLHAQLQQICIKQQQVREQRLRAQQTKNQMYSRYHQVEEQIKGKISKIKQFDGLISALQEVQYRNLEIKEQIKDIEGTLNQEINAQCDKTSLKKQRTNKVKQLNERVLELEKQESRLTSEIAVMEKNQLLSENEKQRIEHKSAESRILMQKIQQAKSVLAGKKYQYSEINSTYKQLCIEENKIKKDIILERECKQEQQKYKDALKSKGHERVRGENNEQSNSKWGQSGDNSFNKLQNIMERFENIKNKNN